MYRSVQGEVSEIRHKKCPRVGEVGAVGVKEVVARLFSAPFRKLPKKRDHYSIGANYSLKGWF